MQYDGDTGKLSQRQQDNIAALGVLGKALGVRFVVFESATDEQGQHIGENGWYDPSDGSIHIDLYAGSKGDSVMLFTAAHELTHFVRDWSPAKFKVLANFLMQEYGKQGVSVNQLIEEQMAKAKRNGMELSYEESFEEVIADSMEAMLSDGKVMDKLAKLKAQDSTLWEKLKEGITWLADKIRELYAGLKPDSKEGRYVAQMRDSIEQLQQLFTEGLQDASANYQAANRQKNTATERQYSLREGAEVDIDKALTNMHYTEDVYLTESSPAIMISQKGVRNLPMLMKASHIRENVFTEQEAKKLGLTVGEHTHYHGLGKPLFLRVIDELEDVTLAYRGTKNASDPSRRENYFVLVSQHKDEAGNVINVPVYIDKKGQYNRVFMDTNKIATVFGRDDFFDYINREVKKGNLVRIKNRSTQASELKATHASSYSKNASNADTVPQSEREVKKFSIRDPELQKANQLLEKENTKLREDVQELKELLKLQRTVTGGTKFTKTSLEAAARYLYAKSRLLYIS